MKYPKTLWCVFKAHGWDNLSVNYFPHMQLQPPKDGPQYFLPCFTTREQAVQWAGSDECVRQLETKE